MPEDSNLCENLKLDWELLKCFLYILVRNAIKHGKTNSIINVHVYFESLHTKKLTVAVENYCIKIDEEDWKQNL